MSAKDGHSSSGSSSSDEDEFVYCACGLNDIEKRFMVECPRCRMWQHGNCLNIQDKNSPSLRVYLCHSCVAEEKQLIKVWSTFVHVRMCVTVAATGKGVWLS